MDGEKKKTIVRRALMFIGFIAAGIAGAATAGELPEQIEKANKMCRSDYVPDSKQDDE